MGRKNNSTTNTENGKPAAENSTSTESTAKRGRPRKQPAAAATGGTETETVVPKLVLVDIPEKENEIDRDETDAAAPKKPAAKKRKRKDLNVELKKEQIAVLVKTVFDIVGNRKGYEVWKLSQEESLLIADPLANILNRNPVVEKVATEYGDYIALIFALGTIILPRAIVSIKEKQPKKEKISYVTETRRNRTKDDESGTAGTSNKSFNGQPTNASADIGVELFNHIPAIY